jgi:hypothetical protein
VAAPPADETHLFGSRSDFAIEYRRSPVRAYAHMRLWISDLWIGNIADSFHLEELTFHFKVLVDVPRYKSSLFYRTSAEVPRANVLREEGGWSFGESFDHFGLVYYRVVDEERIYFCWQMYDQFRYLYPDYPTGELTRAAPTLAVKSALKSLLLFLEDPCQEENL